MKKAANDNNRVNWEELFNEVRERELSMWEAIKDQIILNKDDK